MSKLPKRVYEFGPFRLDAAERLLLRSGEAIALSPKVFDTLVVLVDHAGHIVEKRELIGRLWPDTFVDEGNLTRNIPLLRKALGEAYIETVPKLGYRFTANVTECGNGAVDLVIERHSRSRTPPLPTQRRVEGYQWTSQSSILLIGRCRGVVSLDVLELRP